MPRIERTQLEQFAEQLLTAGGVTADDARLWASMLVKADLQGYTGHGVTRLPQYVDRVHKGLVKLNGVPTIIREGKTTAVMDGGFYIGQVVAHRAMKLAIDKAAEHGLGMVAVRHCGHVGRLADYVEQAVERGFMAFSAVSVAGNNIAPYGGLEPVAGTNPIAFGFPGPDGQDFIFDFATASISMGELQRRVARQEPIPDGVLLDGHGQPTNDFNAFRGPPKGVMMAFGGYKGAGLHMVAEILGGVLSGNGIGQHWVDRGGPAVNAAVFQAIDVEEFLPLEEFRAGMAELREYAFSRRRAPGFGAPRFPGDGARQRMAEQLVRGVELDDPGWESLLACAAELGVKEVPAPLA
jgi:uncharacterized oxidoreductase